MEKSERAYKVVLKAKLYQHKDILDILYVGLRLRREKISILM